MPSPVIRVTVERVVAALAACSILAPFASAHAAHHHRARSEHVARSHRWQVIRAERGMANLRRSTNPYGPHAAEPYAPSAADDPYNPYAPPGAAIRAQARRNQNAPGVTNDLAPDNIATATGGPSGGVPGFSGD